MRIDGEAKDKLYSIMADAIDLDRLYESAIMLLKAEKDQSAELMDEADELRSENARLQERCDVLERSFGDTVALEHTVTELQERNDALRLRADSLESKNEKLEHMLSTEPPPGTSHQPKRDEWAYLLQENIKLDTKLFNCQTELSKYKAFAKAVDGWIAQCEYHYGQAVRQVITERMEKEGYDIEEQHRIEGFGCEDNTEGADEHEVL